MKNKKPSGGLRSSLIKKPIKRMSFLFMWPTIIWFCIGFVWPFLQGIYLSFCKFRITSDSQFIGFGNYLKAIQDPTFIHAF